MLGARLQRWYNCCSNNPWPVILFLLGAVVRIVYIGSIPGGLNQDEASIGYDAFAILHYGMDRNGIHLPIHLIAWGSGQNALYAYFSMPFIMLFGLNPISVRMVSVLMGLLSMVIFYLFSRALFDSKRAGIAAMFLIAINPWHMMMSRWALESNLLPTLILFAAYCLLKCLQSPKWSYGFTVLAALSLYAYGTAYFFVPVFTMGAAVFLLYKRILSLRILLWNALLFALLALPILLFIIINRWKLQSIETLVLSIPRLTTPRVEEISSIFSGRLFVAASANFREFVTLLVSGSDGLPWNTITPYGIAYPIGLPLAMIGLVVMVYSLLNKERTEIPRILLLLWLTAAVLMTLITEVNVNRINIIFYPLILLIVEGYLWLSHQIKAARVVLGAVFSIFFIFFITSYFRDFPETIGPAFHESIGEAIQYASSQSGGKVYITDQVNMPYIYVLFYEEIDPHEFIKTVSYHNPGDAFQQVSSFGRYVFGNPDITSDNDAAYILWNGDPIPSESKDFLITAFDNYTVVIPRDK